MCKEKAPKVVLIQRSRGYSSRATLTIDDIRTIVKTVKKQVPKRFALSITAMVNLPAKKNLLKLVPILLPVPSSKSWRWHCPDRWLHRRTGRSCRRSCRLSDSAWLGWRTWFLCCRIPSVLPGPFMAPHVTAQAIKGAVFAAAVFDAIGFRVAPTYDERRYDLIQTIFLKMNGICASLPKVFKPFHLLILTSRLYLTICQAIRIRSSWLQEILFRDRLLSCLLMVRYENPI